MFVLRDRLVPLFQSCSSAKLLHLAATLRPAPRVQTFLWKFDRRSFEKGPRRKSVALFHRTKGISPLFHPSFCFPFLLFAFLQGKISFLRTIQSREKNTTEVRDTPLSVRHWNEIVERLRGKKFFREVSRGDDGGGLLASGRRGVCSQHVTLFIGESHVSREIIGLCERLDKWSTAYGASRTTEARFRFHHPLPLIYPHQAVAPSSSSSLAVSLSVVVVTRRLRYDDAFLPVRQLFGQVLLFLRSRSKQQRKASTASFLILTECTKCILDQTPRVWTNKMFFDPP